jgi:hypothetical protein
VLEHNLETVPRIFKRIRPAFRYQRSLDVLTKARAVELVTKSNLILGMGETPHEVTAALRDLHDAGCEIITITQYLRPSARHRPVARWVRPEEFVDHSRAAEQMGFAGVVAGPLVRSSYRAGRLSTRAINRRAGPGEWSRLASDHVSIQHGRAIFTLSASFHIAENGADHQFTMPVAPPQESVPLWQDRLHEFGDQVPARWLRPRPVEIRYIGDPPWATRGSASPLVATTMVWMRSVGTLPDDPLLQVCVAAYASDMTLLDSVLLAQRLAWAENTATGASLDHAMWFHAPFQAYDWLLHVQEAPATSGARARTHLPPRRAPRGIRRARRANPRPPIPPTLSNHGEPRIRHRKPRNT